MRERGREISTQEYWKKRARTVVHGKYCDPGFRLAPFRNSSEPGVEVRLECAELCKQLYNNRFIEIE